MDPQNQIIFELLFKRNQIQINLNNRHFRSQKLSILILRKEWIQHFPDPFYASFIMKFMKLTTLVNFIWLLSPDFAPQFFPHSFYNLIWSFVINSNRRHSPTINLKLCYPNCTYLFGNSSLRGFSNSIRSFDNLLLTAIHLKQAWKWLFNIYKARGVRQVAVKI